MELILILIMAAYMLWLLAGRAIYVGIKFRKETGISFPSGLNREELMEKLRQELRYPGLKEIFYDEQGRIAMRCTFGIHTLRIEEGRLFVSKSEVKMSSRRQAHHTEEAECLKAYIQKLFNPDAPVNPPAMYRKLKNFRRNSLLVTGAIVAAVIVAFAVGMDDAGTMDGVASHNVSTSYLSEYSESVTIGEAFNSFFSDPEWVSYQDGAQQMVDFKGSCTYDGAPATMIITFIVNKDTFSVEEIKVDGREMPAIYFDGILTVIYKG